VSSRRNSLGRGLGALLPGSSSGFSEPLVSTEEGLAVPQVKSDSAESRLTPEIPIDLIDPNPEQPRRRFEAVELEKLVRSIQRHGVLQPVVVRRAGERYELVVGERRWRATRAAGLRSIPAVVKDVDERDLLEIALVENVQRHDLNPIELAHAFRALAENGATQEEIGERVGLDRSTVANSLRLLDLPREFQQDIEETRLTPGHAKALLQITNPERRRHLRDRIVREGLSVRAAEDIGRAAAGPAPGRTRRERKTVDPNLQRVIDSLRQHLQTRVRIQGASSRGRIEIEFFGEEDLQRLTTLLLGDA
jgi:ParB family chromosome partitioning protein